MPRWDPALTPDFAPPSKNSLLATRILAAPDTVDCARMTVKLPEPPLAWLARRGHV